MSDWVYDWLADLALPALSGIGGIVVGLGAVIVAYHSRNVAADSLGLAQQVRDDEQEREVAAATDRYRDQLFRTVEPAVAALLEHRAATLTARGDLSASEVRNAYANVIARLRLVGVVANDQDRQLVMASLRALKEATEMNDVAVLRQVLGALAVYLPDLLSEPRDIDDLVRQTDALVDEAVEDTTPKL